MSMRKSTKKIGRAPMQGPADYGTGRRASAPADYFFAPRILASSAWVSFHRSMPTPAPMEA